MQKETTTTTTTKKHYVRRTGRILLKTLLYLFLFIILVFLLILTPPVQKFLTGKVQNFLEKKLETTVRIESISFGLSGNVHLNQIYVEDRAKDTLLYGGSLKANISFLKLLSNEVEVKDVQFQNITAKIKRILPDTVFNYQFIVDAFMTEQTAPDTTTAPMVLNISDITLDNVRLIYKDVITGNDVFARIGYLTTTIDTFDPYTQNFSFPSFIARNTTARINQFKPLIEPKTLAEDIAEAQAPEPFNLNIGTVDLSKINVQFNNDISAFYSTVNLGNLKFDGKLIDLQNNKLHFDQVLLNNTNAAIRIGKTETAAVVKQQVKQEVEAEKTAGWDIRINQLKLDNNNIAYDDDNQRRINYGMDYSHLKATDLDLHINNLIVNNDSISANVSKGSFREKSGFVLNEINGDLLYANKISYLKDLYIKTPGSEIKRSAVLEYTSFDALVNNFEQTVMDIDITNSYVQVKDILMFAPQLRSESAFSRPNDVWKLHLVGSGTLNHLNIEALRFDGFSNTHINASGTLVGLMNPDQAGGSFNIYNLSTTQSDIASFTGQMLSTADMNLPESFDLSGRITGNAGRFSTNLNVNTSSGFVALNGSFGNVMKPTAASYNGSIRTSGLNVGRILRQPDLGAITATLHFNGTGLTPETMNTTFRGNINSAGYNNYRYKNISLNGSLKKSFFNVTTDIDDPNIDLDLTVSGNMSKNTSFTINGMVDSIKLHALNFTPERTVFRGQIDGTVANANPNYLDANILITRALFVSGTNRLPLDTVQLISGQSGNENFIRLKSDIANAHLTGQYKLTELGDIIQDNVAPYFSVTPNYKTTAVSPYDIQFRADVLYSPVLASFVPDLQSMEDVHIEGSLASGQGLQAKVTSPSIVYQGNEIKNLNLSVNTDASGMHVSGNIARIKSGSSLDVFNTRITATAFQNNVAFRVGVDDKLAKNKYLLSGNFSQPSNGTMVISLNPDSLMLNYDRWNISPGNSITIGENSITANNFTLSKGGQQLSIQSLGGAQNQPLQVQFTNFKIGTITGFASSDSILVDGTTNGTVTFRNLMEQPLFTSDLTISDLTFKKDTVGNVNLQVSSAGNSYNTNATITGRGNDIALTGSMTPRSDGDIGMDLKLNIRNLEMNSLEGALSGFLTDASGAINGNVTVTGNSSRPNINGKINFNNTSITTVAIGGPLRIDNESLTVTNEGFVFNRFTIRDSANNTLNLSGRVLTSNFINYNLDLNVNADNFRAISLAKTKNSIYYGDMIVTTRLHIGGTESSPKVDGTISINEGTEFVVVVPQEDPSIASREGIVRFVDFDNPEIDTLFTTPYDSLNLSSLVGYDISTNIEISKLAKFSIVIDQTNGDFVNLQGEALLSAGIDPSGKVSLTGSYEIDKGSYQITYNFLQRRFDIQKGSRITWMGEPTNANLDVKAVYVANTAPLDLVANYISAPTPAIRNTYLQKLPFQVILAMEGELMQPIITFDIKLPTDQNYNVDPTIITNVDTRLTQLRQEPSELNKQVFSLLLLNRFVGENPFQGSGEGFNAGSFARQSVSKLLTEQLNNLTESLINGVDLTFDVASVDDYTTGSLRNRTDLNVGLSKRLLNDRLTISVGSNFELEGPRQGNQQASNIAENIAATYQLSRDGRYLLRVYRRNEYFGSVDGYVVETGARFIITLDYDKLSEILRRRKQKVEQGTRETEQTN